jgi:hypothetical protein
MSVQATLDLGTYDFFTEFDFNNTMTEPIFTRLAEDPYSVVFFHDATYQDNPNRWAHRLHKITYDCPTNTFTVGTLEIRANYLWEHAWAQIAPGYIAALVAHRSDISHADPPTDTIIGPATALRVVLFDVTGVTPVYVATSEIHALNGTPPHYPEASSITDYNGMWGVYLREGVACFGMVYEDTTHVRTYYGINATWDGTTLDAHFYDMRLGAAAGLSLAFIGLGPGLGKVDDDHLAYTLPLELANANGDRTAVLVVVEVADNGTVTLTDSEELPAYYNFSTGTFRSNFRFFRPYRLASGKLLWVFITDSMDYGSGPLFSEDYEGTVNVQSVSFNPDGTINLISEPFALESVYFDFAVFGETAVTLSPMECVDRFTAEQYFEYETETNYPIDDPSNTIATGMNTVQFTWDDSPDADVMGDILMPNPREEYSAATDWRSCFTFRAYLDSPAGTGTVKVVVLKLG